jgi:hypothetical protein
MEVPGSLFRADSHLTDEAVALYVDALKLDRLRMLPQSMLEHVEKCETCKQEVTGLFSLLAEEDYSQLTPHPFLEETGNTKQRQIFTILRIAAIIVAVIGIGAIVVALFLRGNDKEIVTPVVTQRAQEDTSSSHGVAKVDKKKGEVAQSLIAARFVESPELEDLMRSSVRSAETEVQSPANGSTVHPGSILRWTTSAQPPFDLTILDNRGYAVKSFRLRSNAFDMKDSLQAGLYYWKLVAEGNLLHVGKFAVR